jgi:hypothetical protein
VKHTKTKPKRETPDELRLEYDLATLLKKGVRGKYTQRYEQGTNLVLLSPHVARDLPNDEAVNEALWLVIQLFMHNASLKKACRRGLAGLRPKSGSVSR